MELNFNFDKKKEPEKPLEEKKPEVVDRTPFDHFDIEAAKVNFVDFEKQLDVIYLLICQPISGLFMRTIEAF